MSTILGHACGYVVELLDRSTPFSNEPLLITMQKIGYSERSYMTPMEARALTSLIERGIRQVDPAMRSPVEDVARRFDEEADRLTVLALASRSGSEERDIYAGEVASHRSWARRFRDGSWVDKESP